MGVTDTVWQQTSPLRVFLLILGTVFFLHFYVIWSQTRKVAKLGLRAPTNRSFWPFNIGLTIKGIRHALKNENIKFWTEVFRDYGNPANPYTVEAIVQGRRIVFTADPENIKAILATQFQDYGKGQKFNEEWHDFLGDSIFTTDGKQWHESRQLIRPQFIKDRVSDLETFEKHVGHLLPLMGDGETVDAADLFFRYTLDAATDFLLGKSVDSLNDTTVDFADAFAEVQRVQSMIARAGPTNFLIPRKTFYANLKKIDLFIKPYIEEVGRIDPEELNKRDGYTFLHVGSLLLLSTCRTPDANAASTGSG